MSPIVILNTNPKLLYYILLESIKGSSFFNWQLGAHFLYFVCAHMRAFLLIFSFGHANPSARIE